MKNPEFQQKTGEFHNSPGTLALDLGVEAKIIW